MKIKQKIAIGYIRLKLKILAIFSKRKAAEEAFRLFSTPYLPKIKTAPPIFENAERLSFIFNGSKTHGYRWNHARPHKILIIHGFDSQSYKFSKYVELLLKKDYEIVIFDAPAHGDSEGKTINALEYSLMIKDVVQQFGPFNGFMAHSFGGIALCLALENVPHDGNTKVVFIAPATETTTTLSYAMDFLGIHTSRIKKAIDDIVFEIGGKKTEWYSMKRAVQNIKADMLWFHDEDDAITPVSDALVVKNENLPNIEFVITHGLGHHRIYHDPAVRERIVDFL
jgi:alpha-beta hydrolase superfamily lysophospholipase